MVHIASKSMQVYLHDMQWPKPIEEREYISFQTSIDEYNFYRHLIGDQPTQNIQFLEYHPTIISMLKDDDYNIIDQQSSWDIAMQCLLYLFTN